MKEEKVQVVFENDFELCYDGVNVRKYVAGKVYSPTHAHEAKMFDAFLSDGRASVPQKIETKAKKEPVEAEKVVEPKQTKDDPKPAKKKKK